MPNFLSTAARKIRAAGTLLTFGSISDGQALVRSGTSIIGAASGSMGGSTGSTDNALLRADGTGGATIQSSAVTVDDSGNMSGVAALSATTVELGHASDTTLSRLSAGDVAVEGNRIYRASGTDVPLTDGGTGASDRRTAAANLWARTLLRVTYSAQGDGLQSERGAPSGLLSSQVGVSGDRLYAENYSSASASAPGFTTLAARYAYSNGGTYIRMIINIGSYTNTRTFAGLQSGSAAYTGARTGFGTTKFMGFALDTGSSDTTLLVLTSDGSTISTTNTTLTPTAGGWLDVELYRQGSTLYWYVANLSDITGATVSSSASGTHTGSLPSDQTLGWQVTTCPTTGTPSLSVKVAVLQVGQY